MNGLKEGQRLELKRQWIDRALEDLAAFANTDGGRLLLGVEDSGRVVGFGGGDAEIQKIANLIHARLGLTPRILLQEIENLPVLVIEVEPAQGVILYNGRYLRRVGSTNRDFAVDELAHHVVRRSGLHWDSLPSPWGIEQCDPQALHAFVQMARPRLPQADAAQPALLLQNLDLLREGRLTHAGVLLFAARPQALFPQALARMGVFRSPTDIVDSHDFEGNLWQQVEAAMERFRRLLQVRFDTSVTELSLAGLQRRETWEYPLDALREAVINALIHRDYMLTGHVQVRVHDDRLEVWSPGELPPGVTPELLRGPHGSYPRNPTLARVFFFAGLIEQWGSGTLNILRLCRQQGLPEPVFQEYGPSFLVTFLKDPYTPERLQAMGLNERQIMAVLYVRERGSITNTAYQGLVTVSKRTSSRDLEDLVVRGVLERFGRTGKGTHYVLKGSQTGQRGQEVVTIGSKGPRDQHG